MHLWGWPLSVILGESFVVLGEAGVAGFCPL